MASSQDYSRSVLRVSVAQICQNLGWNATQTSPLELLTDVLERYLEEIGKVCHRYSEQFGRTQPNLDDLGLTFRHMGINIGELEDYVHHVDPVPFAHEVVAFPAPKTNNLQFPNPSSREILHHREEHIHEHLPHMFPGMADEVVEETTATPALTSQPPAQENTPMDVSAAVVGEKRPLPPSAEGPPPGKRPRVTTSNLPEEAGHSQYEMTSITMTPGGFLTPTRGKGRLPDSRTPPPTIRHALTFADTTPGGNRGVDGSEANKENTVLEPPPKEPPMRISLSTGKDGSTIVSGSSSSKPESAKSKGKKKDKVGPQDKAKKPKKSEKKKLDAKIKVMVGDSQATSVTGESSSKTPTKKAKVKGAKAKDGKPKEGKLAKLSKVKEKSDSKKKPSTSPTPSSTVVTDGGSESRLKDLLLSQSKYKLDDIQEPGPSMSSLSTRQERNLDPAPSPESDLTLRQAFPPTDIFESSSHETSPQRLIIAEAEGRAQEREEEKRLRLKNIDETISAVVRDSAADAEQHVEQGVPVQKPASLPKTGETPSPKKRGRPKKVKPKEKIKSSEFVAEEVIKQEKEDEMGARNAQSINDTINAVIMQGSQDSELPTPNTSTTEPSSIPSTPTLEKKPKKEGKKKKGDKSPGVKKKLKAKLQNKADKGEAPAPLPPPPPFVDIKPFVSDKFSNALMKVFEFGDADSPPPALPVRRPSQAEKEQSPPPVSATPPPRQGSFSPIDIKPLIKSPTPETAVAASSASTSSAASLDQPPILPLKIGIPKEKERHRDKSKDKEHRKEKKEKRRDKEKKKKNKDKDRDRDRHDRHHHEHKHDKSKHKEETSGRTQSSAVQTAGFKIKIKIGSMLGSSPSVTVTENKAPAEAMLKQETSSPPLRPEIPKLVIRRDATDGNGPQKKHTSKVTKSTPFVKAEPRNTPPTLHPASPLPGTPPPPVLSRNNSPVRDRTPSPAPHSPFGAKTEVTRETSPVCTSSPPHAAFTFTSPQSSPPRGRPSVTPPPHTPSPPHPKSPSPMPKTPSPQRQRLSSSPQSLSSPLHRSPSVSRKSPTPTPKTPSLSPAYSPPSPVHSDYYSPARERSPDPIKPLFGTPEREASPPPFPLFPEAPVEEVKPAVEKPEPAPAPAPPPPAVIPKPKGKVGRPRSKSPRATSPKRKSPKSPKGKATKSPKAGGTGKSPGRGRPPKAKTLALRAALAAAAASEEAPQAKPKPKPPPPAPLEIKTEEVPAPSPPAVEVGKDGLDSSSESPSPTNLSIAFSAGSSSRQRGTVEAETVGYFIDATTGLQVWICPACKLQDDGSPMIGCDKCDDWYHWVCVNITKEPPEEESWFCPRCSARAKQVTKPKAKRGRKKKVH